MPRAHSRRARPARPCPLPLFSDGSLCSTDGNRPESTGFRENHHPRNTPPEVERFLALIELDPTTGCLLWRGPQRGDGYGRFRQEAAHRLAYVAAHGPIADGLIVRHSCHNRLCVNALHLQLGTHADNRRDCVEAGRQAKGERNGRAKLTEEQVVTIVARLRDGETLAQLARTYGVTRRAIRFIRNGQNWRHLRWRVA